MKKKWVFAGLSLLLYSPSVLLAEGLPTLPISDEANRPQAITQDVQSEDGDIIQKHKAATWSVRTLDEIKQDVEVKGDTYTYVTQQGDTIVNINLAMGFKNKDLIVMSRLKEIPFDKPGTKLTVKVNNSGKIDQVILEETHGRGKAVIDNTSGQPQVLENTLVQDNARVKTEFEANRNFRENQAVLGQVGNNLAGTPVGSLSANQGVPVGAQNQNNQAVVGSQASQGSPSVGVQIPAEFNHSPWLDNPMANPENEGLQPHVALFKELVGPSFGITEYSLYRPGDPQDHGQGLAIDFMTYDDKATGDAIAALCIANMDEWNISYVIWQQQIFGDWNRAWEWMEDRGSITQNHYDHVHVSFH